MARSFGSLVAVLIFFALAVPSAWSQAGGASGSIAVTVVDATGSVVVEAELQLTDLVTNTMRRALTQESGHPPRRQLFPWHAV